MLCLIHEDGKLEDDDFGVCLMCRKESYVIMKQLVRRGYLPKWVEELPCWIDLKSN